MPRATPEIDSSWLTGLTLGDRYTLHEPIGRGSAGQVYRAVQHPLERAVAVKVLRSDLPPGPREVFGQRFLREAALAGKLRHPNIVTVHDFGEQGDILYVVMELLVGRTLSAAIKDAPLPPTDAARIVSALARGLRHAHQAGLVHRDVKPSNVMLVVDDEGVEQPKLMDFGLVRDVDAQDLGLTAVGQYMGTPAFMAPEQARSPIVDHRADIYALGVTLYRAVCGALPFEAEDALSMALQHQSDAIPAMSTKGARVPVAIEAIARRAMEKSPASRYEDAGKMADALDAWLASIEEDDRDEQYARQRVSPKPRAPFIALLMGIASILGVGAGLLLVAVGGVGVAIGWWSGQSSREPIVFPAPPSELAPVEELEKIVPAPPPTQKPKPAPKVSPAAPRPAPPKPAAPKPAADPPPTAPVPVAPPGGALVDGVIFDAAHAARALAFVNSATPDTLETSGVYNRGVGVILQHRPFASIEAFGATSGVGEKTVQAIAAATR